MKTERGDMEIPDDLSAWLKERPAYASWVRIVAGEIQELHDKIDHIEYGLKMALLQLRDRDG